MTNQSVKAELMLHGLHLWQLCQQLGISRQTYYNNYVHKDFKNKKTEIKNAIKDLIKGDVAKNAD